MCEKNNKIFNEKFSDFFNDDSYKAYIDEISKYPILSIEEQKELARKYHEDKDELAKETLIKCNLRFVVKIAFQYKQVIKNLQILDIIQEGNIGLIYAIEKYEPSLGAFTTYSEFWIKNKILKCISNLDCQIRKPSKTIELVNKYKKIIEEYKNVNDEIICIMLSITPYMLGLVKRTYNQTFISMNQSVGEENTSELQDFIPSTSSPIENIINDLNDKYILFSLKKSLTPLEYFILYNRLLKNEFVTSRYLASTFKSNTNKIRHLENKIMLKLKKIYQNITSHNLPYPNTNNLHYEPISPTDIINFLYVKDSLNNLEKELYYQILFGDFKYTIEEYSTLYNIPQEEVQNSLISLREKLVTSFSNTDDYELFYNQTIKKYKTNIYNINLLGQENNSLRRNL